VLIMGFGPRRPNDRGEVAPALCPNCGNHVTFRLLEMRSWFSLFFIPLVPGRARHAVTCPVCQYGILVDGAPLDQARDLIEMTAAHKRGGIDPATYRAAVDRFWAAIGGEPLADRGDARPEERAPADDATTVPIPLTEAPPPNEAQATPNPPAGWYTDPFGVSEQRYWDGEQWTAGTNPPVFER
jgi:hypothetical protein